MNALPHSPYRRAEIESQEEAIDDRTDVQKLHDACRTYVAARRDAATWPTESVCVKSAFQRRADAAERAFADLVHLINEQFGDEVDVELLAKALAS